MPSEHAGSFPPITVANRDPDEKNERKITVMVRGVDRFLRGVG